MNISKIDEERIAVAASTAMDDWAKVAEWADEASTPEARKILHSYAVSGYHREEYSVNGEI